MKHNIDKPEVEEMLSRYIDGEASDRERTEIKRLAANDEQFAERIVRTKQQRQLLANLPSENAPSWLVSDIKQTLERRLLLNEQPELTDDAAGLRHLVMRHFMTAAIITVLFGGLAFMVVQVLRPAAKDNSMAQIASMGQDKPPVKVQEKGPGRVVTTVYNDQVEVFSASLQLTCADAGDVNNHIGKVVNAYEMLDDTYKDTQGNMTHYYVTADIDEVRTLLAEISPIWGKCKQAKLTAFGRDDKGDVIIENATAAQTAAIFKPDKFDDRLDFARDFADFNAVIGTPERRDSFANRLAKRDGADALEPEKPRLTSGRKMPVKKSSKPKGERVSLKITVAGI